MIISGSVYDKFESLPGANVLEVGTSNGVSTDANGNYQINVASINSMLQISYVGYQTVTLPASQANYKSIELQQSNEVLDEVTVINNFKKKDYTLWYILGALVVGAITVKVLNRPQPVKV